MDVSFSLIDGEPNHFEFVAQDADAIHEINDSIFTLLGELLVWSTFLFSSLFLIFLCQLLYLVFEAVFNLFLDLGSYLCAKMMCTSKPSLQRDDYLRHISREGLL